MVQLYYRCSVELSREREYFGEMVRHTAACPSLLLLKNPNRHTHYCIEPYLEWKLCVSDWWIWTAKENSEYWHKIYCPGHTPFMTNASYFNLIKCWQVYLARHRLRKWSNGRVGVNSGAAWRIRGRRLLNHAQCNTTVVKPHRPLCTFKSSLVMPFQGPPESRKIFLLITSC